MFELLIAILIVLSASALCSGSEAALLSVPLNRVRQLAEGGKGAAVTLLHMRQNMGRPIAGIVILNNIANIVGSMTVAGIAAGVLGDAWLALFSGVLTFLVIVVAEIIPKTIGERHAEPIALFCAGPVRLIARLLTPLIWLVERVTAPFTRGRVSATTDESEIKLLARIGHAAGVIEADESEMIQRVFRLNDVTAADLMTPRVSMTSLRGAQTLADAQAAIIASAHSRIVIVGETRDEVLGIGLKSELLTALLEGQGARPLRELARPARHVPEGVRADRLLEDFRKHRSHLFVVSDEGGGVSGVVTLEDVLETVTGEIVDETDRHVNMRRSGSRGQPG